MRRRSRLPQRARKRKPRVVVDSSVLVAGIADVMCKRPSELDTNEWLPYGLAQR